MMTPITDMALVIRSKNAGPYELVLDILFKNREDYLKVKRTGQFTAEVVSGLYKMKPEEVLNIVWFDPANAVKVVLPRLIISGGIGDSDVYGAQQHAPLLAINFNMD
ncbi:DUF4387 domain-containing protein [Enterobacter sp. ENT03]|uniref:DUF4387 domain-containing protein n=1 Tax=Enterobacter sp. ENT03 TaxID=2854780 RepID=UPI001C44D1C2|nr:DUF4387 domain-containing protein [Enterobacter sp. ENT03]MBV7404573.1 DUF4387 domain-containing protein [Enterobacter sp. ENT03]